MPRLPSQSDANLNQFLPGNLNDSSYIDRARGLIVSSSQLGNHYTQKYLEWYRNQPRWKQIGVAFLAIFIVLIQIAIITFHKYLIGQLVRLADKWHDLSFGHLLLFTLVFFVGFPPLIGFSALSMLSGMVYGFLGGWPILATASITGSFCSFLVFRYILHNQAERLIHSNEKFRAFSEILKEDQSLLLLILIRLCPLPYSLSNGALAAVPNLPALTYFLASLLTSPKLLIHTFVGHKIKELGDASKTTSGKVFDVVSILITAAAASATTYIIYSKMQEKLRAYHSGLDPETGLDDQLIFGNFDDDLESGNNVELNSADFDADNFIIEDDDEAEEYQRQQEQQKKNKSTSNRSSRRSSPQYDDNDEWGMSDDADDLGSDNAATRNYRDH